MLNNVNHIIPILFKRLYLYMNNIINLHNMIYNRNDNLNKIIFQVEVIKNEFPCVLLRQYF